jgi:hypothetical protein
MIYLYIRSLAFYIHDVFIYVYSEDRVVYLCRPTQLTDSLSEEKTMSYFRGPSGEHFLGTIRNTDVKK